MTNFNFTTEAIPQEVIEKIREDISEMRREKERILLEIWKKEMITELNITLIQRGIANKIIKAEDVKEFSRAEVVKTCKEISELYKKENYGGYNYAFAESNKNEIYEFFIITR